MDIEDRDWQQPQPPAMSRADDPEESRLHEASVPKNDRQALILRRLADGSRQAYNTLCDFGQAGGPAANRTLLTDLERRGLVVKDGRIGAAGAFRITNEGRKIIA